MKNIKKSWFTLVELIVVITILAILWSIAFISLQGYSSDARNSKRTSDLNSIQSAMSTQLAQGQAIKSFVWADSNGNAFTNINIAWTWSTTDDYAAGSINYAALPVKAADFLDPSTNAPYVIGITTKNNGKYELAASIEQGAGSKVARVVWNYNARGSGAIFVNTWSIASVLTLDNTTNINFFSPGDTVTASGTTTTITKITKVSGDWLTITLADPVEANVLSLNLTLPEWGALIDAGNDSNTTGNVVDGGNALPYK